MRVRCLVLFSAIFAVGCGGAAGPGDGGPKVGEAPGSLEDGGSGDGAADGGAEPGPLVAPTGLRLLFYRGQGGFSPRSSGEGSFATLAAHLWSAEGYSSDETDVWPDDLSPYRLINLLAPGHREPDARFSSAQVAALQVAMEAGTRVVIWGERSACLTGAAADLIAELDVNLAFTGEAADTNRVVDATAFGDHPVADGLSVVRFREPCYIEGGAGQVLVLDTAERPFGAWARPGRGGELMLIGDFQAIDDSGALLTEGKDNLRFGENLARVALP